MNVTFKQRLNDQACDQAANRSGEVCWKPGPKRCEARVSHLPNMVET